MNYGMGATPPSRSPATARRRRWRRMLLVAATVAGVAALGSYRVYRNNFKRLQEVRPGVLYRMGQPSEFGLSCLAKQYDVRTVLCLREGTPHLKAGLFWDPGEPSGALEETYCAERGIRFLHWPLANEAHWPWPTPWHLEQFYRLLDDPENHPVVVHCLAGKHRAGTFAALFRLEYDRWDPEAVLQEMYSFRFGRQRAVQEHNLRTYYPRPRPDAQTWAALRVTFAGPLGGPAPDEYEGLVRRLRVSRDEPAVRAMLSKYVGADGPFALPLAARLIDEETDPLVPAAVSLAGEVLKREEAARSDWAMAAALVADFGPPAAQSKLLALLESGAREKEISPRYRALVDGATARYTRNRIAYLRPLVEDRRLRPEAAAEMYRYADTAVARLTSILDEDFLPARGPAGPEEWDEGVEAAQAWFAEHPEAAEPVALVRPELPPTIARSAPVRVAARSARAP